MSLMPALRAQLFLLARDRATLFWAFGFVPAVFVSFTAAFSFLPAEGLGPVGATVDPLLTAARSAAVGGNPIAHLFAALGAAAIFGGEYRYSTWRLIGPRAARHRLFTAKWCSFVLAATVSLAVVVAGSGVVVWLSALVRPSLHLAVETRPASLAAAFGVSVLELAVLGTVTALLVISARARLGPVLAVFLFSAAQALAESYAPPPPTSGPWLLLPTYAGDVARQWALPPPGLPAPGDAAGLVAILSLGGWCAVGAGLAVWLMRRQDWSRE